MKRSNNRTDKIQKLPCKKTIPKAFSMKTLTRRIFDTACTISAFTYGKGELSYLNELSPKRHLIMQF